MNIKNENIENETFNLTEDSMLNEKQMYRYNQLQIYQLYYPSLHLIPTHITKLTASCCCLYDLSSFKLMKHLIYLDISGNSLIQISELKYLIKLQYLNINDNNIIFIDPLVKLETLNVVMTQNNYIQDFEPLSQHKNFNINWIFPQNEATLNHYIEFLGQNSSLEEAQELLVQTELKKHQSYFNNLLLQKYAQFVKDKTLIIKGEQNLVDLRIFDYMQIENLYLFECYNFNFLEVPLNIRKLVVNQCNLQDLNGLEQMQQLSDLNLRKNRIINIFNITKIKNLRKLDLAQNNICMLDDINSLNQLTSLDLSSNKIQQINQLSEMSQILQLNLNHNSICCGNDLQVLINLNQLSISSNKLQNIHFVQNLINLKLLDISFNQIVKIEEVQYLKQLADLRLDGNRIESFEVFDNLPNTQLSWYLSEQTNKPQDFKTQILTRFQNSPDRKKCNLLNNQEMKSFGFLDFLQPNEIIIENCPNIILENGPNLPKILQINKCNLKSITDIYLLAQLIDLDLGFNNIRDISELTELINLKNLNLQNNDIYRIEALRNLNLKKLNLSKNKIMYSGPIRKQKALLSIDCNLVVDNSSFVQQGTPSKDDCQNFLGPNSTDNQINELNYFVQHELKYYQNSQKIIKNQSLTIENDNIIQNFQFVRNLNIKTLIINKCVNIKCQHIMKFLKITQDGHIDNFPDAQLIHTPVNITSLTINNSNLTNIVGLELMVQLELLNIQYNKIVIIEQIQKLSKLKEISLNGNCIQDLSSVCKLPKYQNSWLYNIQQFIPTDTDLQNYLTDTGSNISLKEFKTALSPKQQSTKQLLEKCKNEMIQKAKITQENNNRYSDYYNHSDYDEYDDDYDDYRNEYYVDQAWNIWNSK
ncbi:leucine-rich_repeat domain-containing protein [Hexamita inflata]|uniref:Leucine-rich repeat domain-containing protein n=1 Tax=Hexamita inflata TaxID=28002 RepID=A0AA86V1B6_9EUKA|nr:leucine-rich repeat domain-containing protein [Hexamita inflata]